MKRYKTLGVAQLVACLRSIYYAGKFGKSLYACSGISCEECPFAGTQECISKLLTYDEWIAWLLKEVEDETDI